MELNDIIKSNEFLISLYVGLIMLISFLIYKIRNQAKKNRNANINNPKPDIGNTFNNDEKTEIQTENDNVSRAEKNISNINIEHHQEKFQVINKIPEVQYTLYSNFQNSSRFSELYEKTDSSKMFKVKTHTYHEE